MAPPGLSVLDSLEARVNIDLPWTLDTVDTRQSNFVCAISQLPKLN